MVCCCFPFFFSLVGSVCFMYCDFSLFYEQFPPGLHNSHINLSVYIQKDVYTHPFVVTLCFVSYFYLLLVWLVQMQFGFVGKTLYLLSVVYIWAEYKFRLGILFFLGEYDYDHFS